MYVAPVRVRRIPLSSVERYVPIRKACIFLTLQRRMGLENLTANRKKMWKKRWGHISRYFSDITRAEAEETHENVLCSGRS